MNFTCIFLGALFTVAGLLFAMGRLHTRTAVWKSLSEDERRRIKTAPLCRNIGEVIMLCGVIFLLKGFVADFRDNWFVIAMIAWLAIAGFDVWRISGSGRYQD